MVYCTKCGADNADDARYCIKCGAFLGIVQEKDIGRRMEEWGEEFGRRAEEWGEQFGRGEDCFGLPHGGTIAGVFFGLIIILLGLFWITGYNWEYLGSGILIILGVLIIAGALYGLTRR
jgi:hypothetical protein